MDQPGSDRPGGSSYWDLVASAGRVGTDFSGRLRDKSITEEIRELAWLRAFYPGGGGYGVRLNQL